MSLFPEEIIKAAQDAQKATGVPAAVTLAQWALESDYGQHEPAGSNNPFGIKAKPWEPSVLARTSEYIHGRWVRVNAPFRKFDSLSEAFTAHGKLLADGAPYQGIKDLFSHPIWYCKSLTGIYATDPTYGDQLIKILEDNNLKQYD